ncbi:MAG: hypothetical protein ACR2JC_18730 [Chloroflexota bacterium]
MNETRASIEEHSDAALYQIRIKGHLDDRWAGRFEGLTLTREDTGVTLLTGPVADQAALHGLLRNIRDLGMPLLSVIHREPEEEAVPDVTSGNTPQPSRKETQT